MQSLIHVANVLLLLSFLVTDILWLRLLNVVAGLCFMGFALASTPPAFAMLAWNALFLIINVVQTWRLLLERRPVRLHAEELALYQAAFRALTPREFSRLLGIAAWVSASAGDELVPEGVRLDRVLVVASGGGDVVSRGARVARVGPGQLVGEMSFLTEAKTSAAVVASEATRCLALPSDALRALFRKHPEMRASMQAVIGHDLAAKLRGPAASGS
jgi:hypothetical protein